MNKKGFTLIELLVVISIISLLSSVILASLNTARAKARDAQRVAATREIQKALELYYSDYGNYPASGGATSPNNGWSSSNDSSWDTLASALAPYIKLPRDPVNTSSGWSGGGSYVYSYYSLAHGCGQQWYMLVFKTESMTVTSPGITTCDGSQFNYGGTVTVGARAR